MFTVIPAIDLKGGRCVRLQQGQADRERVYSNDPVAMARHWESEGARYLHVVDLDGAFQGAPVHGEIVAAIVKAVGIPVEVGGGIRTDGDIRATLARGVERVIVGTRAIESPDDLARLAREFGERLAVGIDARGGQAQARGWVETTGTRAVDLARAVAAAGVATIVFTDTATDGMLRGTNAAAMDEICASVDCRVIASGGISSPADIAALLALGRANLAGAIVGKALYEGTVTLRALQEEAGGRATEAPAC